MFKVVLRIFATMTFLFYAFSYASQTNKPKIDFLFVIDNSGSMSSSQEHLASEIPLFLNKLLKKNIDYRAAVATTDAYASIFKNNPALSQFKDGNELDGPSGARVVTNKTPNAAEVLIKNLKQGVSGSGDERAFMSFRASLENSLNFEFRRNDAHLAIIILSDEDDSSHNSSNLIDDYAAFSPIAETIEFLDHLTQSTPFYRLYTVSAFAVYDRECQESLGLNSQKLGLRYGQLVDAVKGVKVSLCSKFDAGLEQVLQNTLNNMNH